MVTKEEYEAARKQRDTAEETINAYHRQEQAAFQKRLEENPVFTLDELVFSAASRCKGCGAGLAYPKNCGPNHWWDCSKVLLGEIKNPGKEHATFPFSMYSIKSENQPSANGQTTRPAPAQEAVAVGAQQPKTREY